MRRISQFFTFEMCGLVRVKKVNQRKHWQVRINFDYFKSQVYPSQKEERPISRILEIPDQNTLKKVFSQEKQMLPKTGNLHFFVSGESSLP